MCNKSGTEYMTPSVVGVIACSGVEVDLISSIWVTNRVLPAGAECSLRRLQLSALAGAFLL